MKTEMESVTCSPWQIEVFMLNLWVWRRLFINLPSKQIHFTWARSQVVIDGFFYRLASETISLGCGIHMFISFDKRRIWGSIPPKLALGYHTARICPYVS